MRVGFSVLICSQVCRFFYDDSFTLELTRLRVVYVVLCWRNNSRLKTNNCCDCIQQKKKQNKEVNKLDFISNLLLSPFASWPLSRWCHLNCYDPFLWFFFFLCMYVCIWEWKTKKILKLFHHNSHPTEKHFDLKIYDWELKQKDFKLIIEVQKYSAKFMKNWALFFILFISWAWWFCKIKKLILFPFGSCIPVWSLKRVLYSIIPLCSCMFIKYHGSR